MIYVFLANGFEEIEALTPVDLLRRSDLEVKTVAVGGNGNMIVGAHGIGVACDLTENEFCDEAPEVVILPGGMPGTTNLMDSETVSFATVNTAAHGGLVCAICAAPSIPGQMGLLKNKEATCFPGFEEYLDGAKVVDARVVRDGNFITAKGMGCAAEFGLAIIEALCGKQKANEIAEAAFIK